MYVLISEKKSSCFSYINFFGRVAGFHMEEEQRDKPFCPWI
jgi:hypothetical protein